MKRTVANRKKFVAGNHALDWQRGFSITACAIITNWKRTRAYVLHPARKRDCASEREDWMWVYCPDDRSPPLRFRWTARTECRALPAQTRSVGRSRAFSWCLITRMRYYLLGATHRWAKSSKI